MAVCAAGSLSFGRPEGSGLCGRLCYREPNGKAECESRFPASSARGVEQGRYLRARSTSCASKLCNALCDRLYRSQRASLRRPLGSGLSRVRLALGCVAGRVKKDLQQAIQRVV